MSYYLSIYKTLGLYPRPLHGNPEIIVSLTSFPKKINKVWEVIDSMFSQTMQPGQIKLYLTNEEFPLGRDSLPKRLLHYEKLGLEICFRDINLMPHNKYFYALQEHTDKSVVTVDDDMYYHEDLISNLWKLHTENTNCICANTISILPKDDGFKTYSSWKRAKLAEKPSLRNVALGFNGVLYPPHVFCDNYVFAVDQIKTLSLKADDLWLKIHELRENIPVATGNFYVSGIQLTGTQVISLMSSNCWNNENDVQWSKLCNYYKINNDENYE